MKKNKKTESKALVRFLFSGLAFMGTLVPAQQASANNCPDSANLQLVPFTFELDAKYQSQSPMFQGFTSNYFTNLGTLTSSKIAAFSTNGLFEKVESAHIALAYMASGNNKELETVNRDITTLEIEEKWNNGGYLKNLSNGSYPHSLSQRGSDAVITSALQLSNNGSIWTDGFTLTEKLQGLSPIRIQGQGFGNGSLVRLSFKISVSGCQNPYNLYTNSVKILGINTIPLSNSELFMHINSLANKKPEDAGYFKGDVLSFQFNDFLDRDKFFARYPEWIDSSIKNLQNYDWNSASFNARTLAEGWYNLGSNSVNIGVLGMQPPGCLQNSKTESYVTTLLTDCKLGIYAQAAYRGDEKYARYLLLGTADVKLKSPKFPTSPKANTSSSVKKSVNWSCIKGKKILKFTGATPKCPTGYKLKK